jgi:hypothetical protein
MEPKVHHHVHTDTSPYPEHTDPICALSFPKRHCIGHQNYKRWSVKTLRRIWWCMMMLYDDVTWNKKDEDCRNHHVVWAKIPKIFHKWVFKMKEVPSTETSDLPNKKTSNWVSSTQCRSTNQNITHLGPSSKPFFQNQPTASFLADLLTQYQVYRLYCTKHSLVGMSNMRGSNCGLL